jgi:hypothetical protein
MFRRSQRATRVSLRNSLLESAYRRVARGGDAGDSTAQAGAGGVFGLAGGGCARARCGLGRGSPRRDPAYANASLAEQERLGVPEGERQVLPEAEAQDLVAQITAGDPTQADRTLHGLATDWGDA